MVWMLLACLDYDLTHEKGELQPGTDTAAPEILVEPLSIDFGAQLVGSETSEVVTITNVGTTDLVLEAPQLDTVMPFDVIGQGGTLAPSEQVFWTVSWLPEAYVAGGGELLVESDADAETVVLSADTLRPRIELTPTSHDFGLVEIGLESVVEVLIENVGDAPLTLALQDWVSTSEPELSHTPTTETLLHPSQSTSVAVRFAPLDGGPEEGTLTVWSDDPTSPATSAVFFAEAEAEPEGPWELTFTATADDTWEGWIDGVALGNHSGWNTTDSFTQTLSAGDHVIAAHARDMAQVIAGWIAMVEIDGQPFSVTGDGTWLHTPSQPSSGWMDLAFNSSTWTAPKICSDTSPWGSQPANLLNAGAKWVWLGTNCKALGKGWFRLEFTL